MKALPLYFSLLLLLAGLPKLYGQDLGKTPYLTPSAGSAIHRTGGNNPGFGERMDVIRSVVDSLMQKTTGKIGAAADSLAALPARLEAKLRARMDSLQSRLDSLKHKAEGHVAKAEEEARNLTRKIDSLESLLNKGLGKVGAPALSTEGLPKVGALPTEDLSKVGISQLEHEIPGTDLVSKIDAQIKNLGGFGRSGRYEKYFGDVGAQAGRLRQVEMLKQVQHDGGMSQIDQMAGAQASQMDEFKYLGEQTKELEALKGLPEEMLADLKRYQNEQAMKEALKQKAVKIATDYFEGHMDKLTKAQNTMSALKKKYSYVPDSRDLSTAVKATSLKNEPLRRRIKFGLDWQIQRTDPLSLDLSPYVLYRFDKLSSAGISGRYRVNLGIENNNTIPLQKTVQAQDVYGLSAFAQYRFLIGKATVRKILSGFFAYGSFEYMSAARVSANGTDLKERAWYPGLPIGIGKQIRFSKALSGRIIFTYDLLHNENSPNPKAWNIKFGFQLGRFKLKDIRI